jgi:hypothetical protein
MVARDVKRIQEYERLWVARHGQPTFSDVKWAGAERRRAAARATPAGAEALAGPPVAGRAAR